MLHPGLNLNLNRAWGQRFAYRRINTAISLANRPGGDTPSAFAILKVMKLIAIGSDIHEPPHGVLPGVGHYF